MKSEPQQPPRIAYLFSRFPVISQTFCDTEMLALENQGFEIVVGSINPPRDAFRHPHLARLRAEQIYNPPNELLKLMREQAVERHVWPADLVMRHQRDYGAEFKSEQRARNALYLGREFTRRGVEHVHAHFTNRAAHTLLFMSRITGIPFSITAHAQDFLVDLGSDDLLREMITEARFVVAVSDYSRDLLREIAGPEQGAKITRIYNGMDLESFGRPVYERQGPLSGAEPARALKIVSVGRLIEFKGFHKLIEACGELREDGVDVECAIIGEGPWRERLEEQIELLDLQDGVTLTGSLSQDEVRRHLREAHVFALASLVDDKGAKDILPTVILEAMATGLPVVSTRLAGIPEMVIDEETGFLVEPGNAPGFADALRRLGESPDLRERFGRAGRERVEELFNAQKTSARLGERLRASAGEFAEHTRGMSRGAPPVSHLLYLALDPLPGPDHVLALAEELVTLREHELAPRLILSQRAVKGFKILGQQPHLRDCLDLVSVLPPGGALEGLGQEMTEDRVNFPEEYWNSMLGGKDYFIQALGVRAAKLVMRIEERGRLKGFGMTLFKPELLEAIANHPRHERRQEGRPRHLLLRGSDDPVHQAFRARFDRDHGLWKHLSTVGVRSPRARRADKAPDMALEWADALKDWLTREPRHWKQTAEPPHDD